MTAPTNSSSTTSTPNPRQEAPTHPPSSPSLPDSIPASRHQAVQTRRAISPRTQLLSPPGAPPAGLTLTVMSAVVPPDPRFGSAGRARPLVAYDAGLRPPPLPAAAPGWAVQHLDVADTITAVLDRLTRPLALDGKDRGRRPAPIRAAAALAGCSRHQRLHQNRPEEHADGDRQHPGCAATRSIIHTCWWPGRAESAPSPARRPRS